MTYTIEQLDAAVESLEWLEISPDSDFDFSEYEDRAEALRDYAYDYYGGGDGESPEWDAFAGNIYISQYGTPKDGIVNLEGIGTVRQVERHGGGEGDGERYWIVISVTDPEGNVRLFQRNGWYASFNGGYLDGPTVEVEEAVKQVTYYRAIYRAIR